MKNIDLFILYKSTCQYHAFIKKMNLRMFQKESSLDFMDHRWPLSSSLNETLVVDPIMEHHTGKKFKI